MLRYTVQNKTQLSLYQMFNKSESNKEKLKILEKWFKNQSFSTFPKHNRIKNIENETIRKFSEHVANNTKLNTERVPSVWINNYRWPEVYSIEDLPFLLTDTDTLLNIIK